MSYDTPEQRRNRDMAYARSRRKTDHGIKSAQKVASEAAALYAAQQAGEATLTEEAVRKFLKLTPAELNVLAMIAGGRPPRSSAQILAAIKLKLEYTLERPGSDQGKNANPVTVIINTLAGQPPPTVEIPETKDTP